MKLSDDEIKAIEAHYGEALGQCLKERLLDDGPEEEGYLDTRRRHRHLLKLWAGRKDGAHDVHTRHCCETHGCKYGDEKFSPDCSVRNKTLPQEDLCEQCEEELMALRHLEPAADRYAESVVIRDLDEGNYLLVDGEKVRFAVPPPNEEGNPESVRIKAQRADILWAIRCAYLAGATGVGRA
jgi:hypothetical protein